MRTKATILSFLLIFFLSCCKDSEAFIYEDPEIEHINYTDTTHWRLVWSDEFDGQSLDTTKWDYGVRNANSKFSKYNSTEGGLVTVQGGLLNMSIRRTPVFSSDPEPYQCATIHTAATFAATYGRWEARIKHEISPMSWGAFWLFGSRSSIFQSSKPMTLNHPSSPYYSEIDIMEQFGANKAMFSVIHTRYSLSEGDKQIQKNSFSSMAFDPERFNIYTLEWDENRLTFYINDIKTFEYNKFTASGYEHWATWPFDNPMYIILDNAIMYDRENFEGDFVPSTMRVDWVRVYQRK